MSTSIIRVYAITGKAGKICYSKLNRIYGRKDPEINTGYDWKNKDLRLAESIASKLFKIRYSLPVTYYCEYIDSWSVACSSLYSLGLDGIIPSLTMTIGFSDPLRSSAILSKCMNSHRKKFYRLDSEARWVVNHVEEALRSCDKLRTDTALVITSRSVDGSRFDDQISALPR